MLPALTYLFSEEEHIVQHYIREESMPGDSGRLPTILLLVLRLGRCIHCSLARLSSDRDSCRQRR